MNSYTMGYYYDRPKRGKGYNLTCGRLYIACLTKSSALEVKRELIREGHSSEDVKIEKNIF